MAPEAVTAATAQEVPARLRRRLVLCLDGTWNSADGEQITNIVRLRDIVQPGEVPFDGGGVIEQHIYYDEGVGTGGLLQKLVDGATGRGLSRNVRQAYRYLSANYQDGDQIVIFGFSRGAFTARSLAGYIGASGLLRPEHCDQTNERRAWDHYRTPPKERFPQEQRLLAGLCFPPVRIAVLGVFDTVGALGIPGVFRGMSARRFRFHDATLGQNVEIALHALAADEKRHSFGPALWQLPQHKAYGVVEQVWFPGVHSDIGGGCAEDGIGRLVLDWMLKRIQTLGEEKQIKVVLRRDAEHIRTSTACDQRAPIHESRTPLFFRDKLQPSLRVIAQQRPATTRWERMNSLPRHARPIGEYLHITVLMRLFDKAGRPIAANAYAPLEALTRGDSAPIGFVDLSGQPFAWGRNTDTSRGDRVSFYGHLPAQMHPALDAFLAKRWASGMVEPDPQSPF
ncbi:DUF2235 domain-containing protein [Ancylobacter sp.]|uniref:DUF2235 domain-containing protein n=1 Tax=Ancylobacter sp. TaxID=1872567 RepID=UPI003D151196